MVEDSVLIARGQMATLQHEKRKQMAKAQSAAKELMAYLSGALRAIDGQIETLPECDATGLMQDFQTRIQMATDFESQIQDIKPVAWPSLIK